MYDFLIQTNTPLFKEDGGAMGGTERQIMTVAEKLASKGCNVGIIHSETDGSDRIINDVKHLNLYRHHFAQSKVRLYCNHFGYNNNIHKGYALFNPHIDPLSSLELNSAEKNYIWIHNWYACHDQIPRISNSFAVQKYIHEKGKKLVDDHVIHYMIPKGISVEKRTNRSKYLYWMSAFGKGLKEAVLLYISLYERGLNREFNISIPPQKQRKDVEIVRNFLNDANKHKYPINFLGELDYNSALKNLSNSACLFRPSKPPETFGLVYLEANQLGIPVITYEGDAGEEILTDSNNFIIRKNHNIDDINQWLNNIETKFTEVNMEKFDPEVISKKWIKLLD